MLNTMQKPLTLAWLLLAILLTGCSSLPKFDEVIKDRSADYKSSRTLPPLEVPPDLSSTSIEERMVVPDVGVAPGTATYSEYAGERRPGTSVAGTTVLANPKGIRVERDGDKRWLVLDGPPSAWWSRVREFWLQNGLLIKEDNPSIGIMETDWAENRADIPKGFIRNMIGKVLDSAYSAATRDKFRVRFERGEVPDTTELFLSHQGVEEVVQGDTTVWQPRPADPELEAEMLNRLMVFLGVKEDQAKRMLAEKSDREPRAEMNRDSRGRVSLTLKEDFSRAWRRTGLALDRVGFTVEDRDRSRGLYFVRYVDPLRDQEKKDGLLSKLKFWGDDKTKPVEYLISLVGEEDKTRVVILNTEGKPDYGDTAGRILKLLFDQLK